MVLFRRNVPVNFPGAFSLKIFCDKTLKIHLKIIMYKLQGGVIVLDHQIRILTYNMNLLNFLLVIFAQGTIVLGLIPDLVVKNHTLDFHTVIKNQKSTFQSHGTDL